MTFDFDHDEINGELGRLCCEGGTSGTPSEAWVQLMLGVSEVDNYLDFSAPPYVSLLLVRNDIGFGIEEDGLFAGDSRKHSWAGKATA